MTKGSIIAQNNDKTFKKLRENLLNRLIIARQVAMKDFWNDGQEQTSLVWDDDDDDDDDEYNDYI